MDASKLKVLRVLNLIAIGIPIVLCLMTIFEEDFLFYAALSTMITGFIQVVVALVYWSFNKKDVLIIVYFIGVLLFGLLALSNIVDNMMVLPVIPFILCVYLSYIIHFKKHQL